MHWLHGISKVSEFCSDSHIIDGAGNDDQAVSRVALPSDCSPISDADEDEDEAR